MPIYEYRCTKCGRTFETIQKMSDAPLETCEACSGPLEKLFSRTSFQLAGGGWYSSGYSKAGGSGDSSSPETKPSSEAPSKPKAPGACGAGCGCH
ncbi:MAG TPA: FmdB family zinc ribbon protein [Candidatus Polarisedimenticolaceae bacterium]